ncbi:geranylgeranylglyceryl/heptaprenylglyceryl phosphate synthase [Flavobacterium sp.]|uniref:geranylgeranylglyceryl/heptaprenylglyceryl phosphate synthase n=1 Tax=Flavobacterium sp. TaxID=239 RepID=UPI0035276068
MTFYQDILSAISSKKKLLGIVIDPEKMQLESIPNLCKAIKKSPATHILFGGSTYNGTDFDKIVSELKRHLELPIFLFPGDYNQLSNKADVLLFLSLLSGRNPEYLIGQQTKAVNKLKQTTLEIIPTAYLLIESGVETAVERVSNTIPIGRENIELAIQTAKAGEYLGMKMVYLEAGSGAKHSVPLQMITNVKQNLTIPLIVGGGLRSKQAIEDAFSAGADMIIIGTAFENDLSFFN